MISPLTLSWLNFTVVVERLGWVLLHSLWQIALVALLAGVTVRALRRRSASTRYVVLVSAMAVSVVVPAATWMLQHGEASGHWTSRKVSAAMPDTADEASRRVPPSNLADDPTLASAAPVETPIPGHTASRTAIQEVPRQTPMEGVTAPPRLEQARTTSQLLLAWIVAGWSLGVVICSLRPLLGWHTLRRLRRVGVSPVSDEVLAVTQSLSNRLGVRRAVRVLQSTLARMPIVVGYVRPVILLPVCLLTSIPAAQLEAIMAHELAHVRRHDFVVNLLQTLVETLFFYHPAVWWLSRQICVEREHCCDDQVVALLGNRVEYGRALVAVEELQGRPLVLALGVNDGSLLARIRRIVGVGPDCTPHERWPAALLGLVLLGAMCALSMTWSVAATDDVRHEPQPVVGPTPEREKGQLPELVGWSADSAQVFTTSTFNRLMRWERSGTALKLKASEIPGNEAFAHANSMAMASRSGRIILGTNRGTVQFWDAAALDVQKQIAVEPDSDRYPTYAVAISPDESVVAEFGWSGHLYDMATMKRICLYGEREKRRMSVLAFAPNGRTLVGLDRDGLLTLWNIPDGTRVADWHLQHISEHATVQWSQEGDLIAVVNDGTVAFVTPTSGSTPRVVFAPDAVCQMTPENTEIESRVRRADLPDGVDFAGVMALASDFNTVASVKIDASVAIWDVETREVISHLAPPPSAHKTECAGVYVQHLTFSPNGRHLACTREVEGDLIWWTLSDEPVESARVRIHSADGSPAALNGLVNASVGFSALKVPAWSVFATKADVVPLDDLPPGTHWLVAKADSEERTAFQVTLPRPGAIIERRLRSPAGWVSKEIELKPSVDRSDPDDEMIVVELHNASGADITVTADAFSLTMSPNLYRVFAPQRRNADTSDATRLTIANGDSGTMRLSWHRWIREGLWASRIFEDVSEPWSVNSDAGKIQVRVNLGNRGSLPIFVTAPKVIAAARPEATDEAAAYKPFDCEIVDTVTGKLIEEAEFHFSFHFMKPATKDAPAKEAGHAIWAPKASSKFSFVIPDKVLQRPDRDKLVVEWFVRHPKYETLVSKEPVSLLAVLADEPKSARNTFRKIKLTPKKVVGATAPAKGLEFLKPYPNLHGLSLAMTEPQFRAFAKKGELMLQMTPRVKDRSTYSIPTGDGHTVIVVFQSGKCHGIQRIRGEDRVDKISFESVTVTFKAALGNDLPQQIQIKADGSCVYHIDGRHARGDIQRRPEARLTSKVSPQRMLELERLLAKTNWLTVAGGVGPARHTDAEEITITVARDDQTKTVVCIGMRPEPYHSLLWFLRGMAEQEKLVYVIDWLHGSDTDRKLAFNRLRFEIDALNGQPGRALPYLELDYNRFLPTFTRMVRNPSTVEDEVLTAIKLVTFVRADSELEWIARLKHDRESRVRNTVAAALADFGGERVLATLVEMAPTTAEARWGLIRLQEIAVPSLVKLIESGRTSTDITSEHMVRAFLDHRSELPGPIDDRIVTAARQALAKTTERHQRTEYFKEFLQLADEQRGASLPGSPSGTGKVETAPADEAITFRGVKLTEQLKVTDAVVLHDLQIAFKNDAIRSQGGRPRDVSQTEVTNKTARDETGREFVLFRDAKRKLSYVLVSHYQAGKRPELTWYGPLDIDVSGRESRARDATERPLKSDDGQSTDGNTNRDPRSNEAAGSGVPRQTQVLADIPDAEYQRPTADDQKGTAMIPADSWGSPVNGLRAAILMQSPPVDQIDSLRYQLVVENVSNHDIRFSATVAPDFRDFHLDLCTLSLFGLDDEPLPREKPNLVSYVVQPWMSRFWLKAGERAFVRRDGRMALARLDLQGLSDTKPQPRASAFFKVRPGRYLVSATAEFGRETRSTSPIFRYLVFLQNCHCAMPLDCASLGYGVYVVRKPIDGRQL